MSGPIAHDSSGHGQNGRYAGSGLTYHVPGALAGDTDEAISTDGTTAVTQPGRTLPAGSAPRTFEVWLRPTTDHCTTVLQYGDFSDHQFEITQCPFNQTIDVIGDGGQTVSVPQPPGRLDDGAWHLLDVTYDGHNVAVYVDGQPIGGGALTLDTTVPGNGLSFGAVPGGLDEMAIYPGALSAARITAHWSVGASKAGAKCAAGPAGSYAEGVLADRPVGYFRLDELGSDPSARVAYDVSGHCHNAAYMSGVTAQPSGALPGDPDGAVSSGGGFALNAGAIRPPAGSAPRTFEAWLRPTTDHCTTVLRYGDFSDHQFEINQCPFSDTIDVIGDGGQMVRGWQPDPRMDDGRWHLLDVTYDGHNVVIYLDGQAVGSGALTLDTTVPGNGLFFGAVAGGLDEFAIYDYALSPGQISSHDPAAPTGGPLSPGESRGGGGLCLPCLMKSIVHSIFGAPVDAEDGNMYHTFNDVQIAGRGVPLAFTRTYNSNAAATNGRLGYGWVDNLGASLAVSGSTAVLTEENGAQTTFAFNGTDWKAPPRDIATLVHNGDGTWTLVRHAQQTLRFDSAGQLTAISDLNGNTLSYTYSGGRLRSVEDGSGRSLTLGYSGAHLVSVTDASVAPKRVVRFGYDGAGNLTDVLDVGGGHTHFTYDSAHRMLSMKDPKCYATAGCRGIVNTYDSQGRVITQADQLGRKTRFFYVGHPGAASGGTTTITDPKGNVTVDRYVYGVKVAETRGAGTSEAATTSYSYDPATLQPTAISDPNGHTTSMSYDASGNLLKLTDPLGRTTTYSYNQFNKPLTVTDGKGITTTNTYDARGNLTSVSTPCPDCTPSGTRSMTYIYGDSTHPGDITSLIDPAGNKWSYSYDAYGNRVSTTDPLGHKTTSTYNADGWLLTTVAGKGNLTGCGCAGKYRTTYSYTIPGTSKIDEFGDVQRTTDPLGHVTTYGYDADRNVTSTRDPDGNLTRYVYDLTNQRTKVVRPGAPSTTLVTDYNRDGTVLDQKDGKGHVIQTYAYDSLARVTKVTDALGNATRYTYDPVGNRLTQQDPGGNCAAKPATGCTTYRYDAANELTKITYSDRKTPNVTGISYDADGQRKAMTDGTGTWSWTWDALHRLTSVTEGRNGTVKYTHDLRGLLTSIDYPSGHTVSEGYDKADRWTSVRDWLGHTTTFAYDPNNNLIAETLPSASKVVDRFSYDAADRLTGISDKKRSAPLFSARYTRDQNGQLTSDSSVPAPVLAYRYTPLNQLCYAGSSSTAACAKPPTGSQPYSYDTADNLIHNGSATQAFNAADELCWTISGSRANACSTKPSGATAYAYSPRGNLGKITPATGAATILGYDQASRLVNYAHGSTTATYGYNGDGLRMRKTVKGTTAAFVWDLSGPMPLLLADRSSDFVYGPGGLPLEQITGSTARWLHHDQLGSTRLMTNAAGQKVATYTYSPYGAVSRSTGTVKTPILFSGQYADAESGLYYLRARYYDPATGQFLTLDPAVAGTMSPYAYGANNALNRDDPSGLGLNLPLGLCLKNPFSNDDSCESTGAIAENATHVCTVFDENCAPVINSAEVCLNVDQYRGLGGGTSVCLIETNGYRQGGLTVSPSVGGGFSTGPGASVTVGPVFGATCPEDVGGPFADAGGGGGGIAGGVQIGTGTNGQPVVVPSIGFSTPGADVHGDINYTFVHRLWG